MKPIAIVGRACVLPGALSPQALWQALLDGRDLTQSVRDLPGSRWGLAPAQVLCSPDQPQADRCWTDRGAFVSGFEEIWNPHGFLLDAQQLAGLDPLLHWTLHCAREALSAVTDVACAKAQPCPTADSVGHAALSPSYGSARVGAVLGNLGFPSASMAAFAHQVWSGEPTGDPRNRHMSGGTAALLAQALGLNAGSYCLDAACASALYAIKLACDQLNEGSADVMLAGAVQRADPLFLNMGFAALGALSRSGQSRPFHADADGLLAAEGCAMFALKRLDDAQRDRNTIFGVIRGIGLCNDGRGKGLLVPDEAGQQRAMRSAYASAGIDPTQVSLLECHATGTLVGDSAELRSSAAVFAGHPNLPIGSLKSNLGHLITVAGAAGLIKLLEALRHGIRPPNRPVDKPIAALATSPFRLLQAAEAWPDDAPRIAAISAFGFGGNNAHLIVSASELGELPQRASASAPIAIVGIGCMVGGAAHRRAFTDALFATARQDQAPTARMQAIELDLAELRFPPLDLQQTLPQQLAILAAAREALAETGPLPRERSAVLIGMEPDAEIARYGTRWRLAQGAPNWRSAAQDALIGPLQAAGVLGCMPNIPANRLSSQFDLAGPAFTLQAGAMSGLHALRIALRGLRSGELDAALVGAVDLCCEPVNQAAGNHHPVDAALVLVLKRLVDAERAGDRIYALLDDGAVSASHIDAPPLPDVQTRWGNAGAAAGLLQALVASLCLHHRRHADGRPWLSARPRGFSYAIDGLPALALHEAPRHARRSETALPRLHLYSGVDRAAVIEALQNNVVTDNPATGSHAAHAARLVLIAKDADLPQLRLRALAHLQQGRPAGAAVHFCERPIGGEIAFVFAGAGASYHGMGRELLTQLPQLLDGLAQRSQRLCSALDWSFAAPDGAPSALQQLWGASALAQLHVQLSQGLLGLQADAWLGYSSGETNALVAAGVWNDPDALMADMETSGLIDDALGGAFSAVAALWGRPVRWASYTVLAPLAEIRAALTGLDQVYVAIINSDNDVLIAGDADACAMVVERVGAARCIALDYPLAVHVPELQSVADRWLALHQRSTQAPRHGRIYSTALARAYAPDTQSCASAILEQANKTLDLRPLVQQAWEDGVRVFIEHGPGNSFARAIRHVLGDRPALILSLDRKNNGLEGVLGCAAALLAAGVAVDVQRLQQALAAVPAAAPLRRPMRFAAHWPAIVWPMRGVAPAIEIMRPAPPLPKSVLTRSAPVESAPAQLPEWPSISAANLVLVSAAAGALLAPYRAQLRQLAAQQQLYQHSQSLAHQQFLAHRARAQTLLFAAAGLSAPRAALPSPCVVASTLGTESTSAAPAALVMRLARADLEIHADGRISEVFGSAFAGQDGYARQVRMPRPPLLLADRVLALEGTPGGMGKGRVVTETDVANHAWALQHGRLPAGVMIEAGQADLLLISWLGVDAFNRGERVYRLLGCELTYHGDLPQRDDHLRFDIQLDGHAAQGDVRLMFFHYDCVNGARAQLSVRHGQAGFFTDAELVASSGCLWSAEQQQISTPARLDAPDAHCQRRALNHAQLLAFAQGDAASCFGAGFELARTHTRSPSISTGKLLLLSRVTDIEAAGGPWQRGYLRAELDIEPDQWFFDGHFKNDPCMPGTLMFEGCLQAMAVYLASCGYTLKRDGWRFQPVPELPYALQCRGQVTPSSQLLVTEVFVEERSSGPQPTVYADLLCTVDGKKAFHARRVALQLVPDWPLDGDLAQLDLHQFDLREDAHAPLIDGFSFGPHSLLACALGRPSQAFGPMYQRFDGPQRVARLPSPPYHFISRIASVEGPLGVLRAGARVLALYDIPSNAWYFNDSGQTTMPFAVLLEVVLQPCGWLSSYVGSALTVDSELGFRNLDGEGSVSLELRAGGGTLSTEVLLTEVSASAGMIIENFSVVCRLGDREVYRLKTVFGFFPPDALAAQLGLPINAAQRALFDRTADLETAARVALRIPAQLRMIDAIEGYWPSAGDAGLGQLRAVKAVDPGDWFFKAHFFQDPVQPGSLGLEAMLQTLQWYLLQQNEHRLANPRFESMAVDRPHRWKYRGQVLPQHRLMHTTLDITERGRDARGVYAVANASLWADGQRIYEAQGLAVRLVADV